MTTVASFVAAFLSFSLLFVSAEAPTPIPDCPACWCKSAGDCPDPKYACPSVKNCRTAVVKDRCGFCNVCLKDVGEPCRREPLEKQDKMCDRGLACKKSDDEWYCADMEPDNVKVSRCEKVERSQCYDLATGKLYRTGEIWIRGDFACTACTCKSNGKLRCWGMQCNVPDCNRTTRVEGRCCTFCMGIDRKKVCKYNGKTFFENEIIVLEDHRSICKCEESQGWACQHDHQHAMAPLEAEKPKCVDPLSEEVYKKGEIWSLSECAHCQCGESSQTGNCSAIICPRPQCEEPFKMKGRCCPACPRDYGRVCHFQGVKHFHGELLVLPDRCTLCTCSYSRWQCSSDRCKFTKMIKEPLKMSPK